MEIDLSLDNRIILYSKFDAAIQEIDLLFNTSHCELLGDTSYGTNFEQFLWTLNPSPDALKKYINEKISKSSLASEVVSDVDVKVYDGEYRNIYDVQLTLTSGDDVAYRKYEFR